MKKKSYSELNSVCKQSESVFTSLCLLRSPKKDVELYKLNNYMQVMVKRGDDPNLVYPDGRTPLDLICVYNNPQLMLTFLQYGAQFSSNPELTARIRFCQSCSIEQLKEFIKIYMDLFVLLVTLANSIWNEECYLYNNFNLKAEILKSEADKLYLGSRKKYDYSYKLASAISALDTHSETTSLFLKNKIVAPFKNELLLSFKALITLKETLSNIPYEKDFVSFFKSDEYHDYRDSDKINNYWLLVLAILHFFSPQLRLGGAAGDFKYYGRSEETILIQEIYAAIDDSSKELMQLQTKKDKIISKVQQLSEKGQNKIHNWELNQEEQLMQEVQKLHEPLDQLKTEPIVHSTINNKTISAYLDLRKRDGAVGNDNKISREIIIQESNTLTQLDADPEWKVSLCKLL